MHSENLVLKFFFSLLFFLISVCFAESFRTQHCRIVNLSSENQDEQNVKVGVNGSVVLFLPDDLMFFEGIEVKIQIPNAVSQWRDSVAFCIYDSVSPEPNTDQIDYFGKRVYLMPLPSKVSWIVQIPFSEKSSIKDNGYITKTSVIPDISDKYVFLRFMPVMKGIPEETLNSILNVNIKPFLIDKGILDLKIQFPKEEPSQITVLIDNVQTDISKPILLSCGVHNVSVQTDNYRDETISVLIEKAKKQECLVVLKSLEPVVNVNAPDNSEVFLDDKKIENNIANYVVEEGEHTVRFLIGGYEIIRNLKVQKGKSYNVDISVDMKITEE